MDKSRAAAGFMLGGLFDFLSAGSAEDSVGLGVIGIALGVEGAWTVHKSLRQPWLWPFRRRGERHW
jgi:hypothetical protein